MRGGLGTKLLFDGHQASSGLLCPALPCLHVALVLGDLLCVRVYGEGVIEEFLASFAWPERERERKEKVVSGGWANSVN